ncbi:hypothetical protein [Kitasatospora indigofera]|uniref:hypothetical protein n=1 Tax=Kitasatospora indigofera TaxID=67307 RepID=UPI00167E9B95|nr:hypothetical protein [Kitasatospora indigofera]
MPASPAPWRPTGYAPHLDARLLPDIALAGLPDHGPPLWRIVEVRVGGRWRPAVVERWRLHHGSTRWIALLRWGSGPQERGWVLYDPATVRQAPRPTDVVPGAREGLAGVLGPGVQPPGALRRASRSCPSHGRRYGSRPTAR